MASQTNRSRLSVGIITLTENSRGANILQFDSIRLTVRDGIVGDSSGAGHAFINPSRVISRDDAARGQLGLFHRESLEVARPRIAQHSTRAKRDIDNSLAEHAGQEILRDSGITVRKSKCPMFDSKSSDEKFHALACLANLFLDWHSAIQRMIDAVRSELKALRDHLANLL